MMSHRFFYQVILFITGCFLGVSAYLSKIDEVWLSIGIAFVICSLIRIGQYFRMKKDEEYCRKILVSRTDERNLKIAEKAASLTFRVCLYILCVAELVLFAYNLADIAVCVGIVLCLLFLCYWFAYLLYSKEM